MRYLGFGASALEVVESDSQGAMRPAALAATLFSGVDGPTIVCAQAGNVNSGAFDPFAEICDIAHEHGAWVHIDGAFGLWAAAPAATRHLLDGYERADSWATDAHKWLNVPYDCGIALTAHPADHAGAFAARAEYLVFSDGIRDPMDFTPEASRRARGSRCWAALQSLGRAGVAELVERCCAWCAAVRGRAARDTGVEVANDVVINQIVVRFPRPRRRPRGGQRQRRVRDDPDDVEGRARRADLGLELADDRARHRDLGRRDPRRGCRRAVRERQRTRVRARA